jgi:hypothetical protein
MIPAPIVIFAYRRPEHLRRTLFSLMRCEGFDDSPVIIYGDGPKTTEEVEGVDATQRLAREMLGSVAEYHFSNTNKGLSQSIIDGVTEVIRRFGRAIVIEDDLLLTSDFLTYMNAALDRYANNHEVFQVSGYMFDVPEFAERRNVLFLPFTVSWGWATWERAWDHFDVLAKGWDRLLIDNALRYKFDIDGTYGYSTMLVRQMMGRQDSWAVRWYWSAFQNSALTVFPPRTLVINIGLDGTGSHGRGILRNFSCDRAEQLVGEVDFPRNVSIDECDSMIIKKSLRKANGRWLGRAVDYLRWIAAKNLLRIRRAQ